LYGILNTYNMSLALAIVILASVLAIIGNVPYINDVLRGKVRPHPYTWVVGAIVSTIVFLGQTQAGAGLGAIPTFVSALFAGIIFLLSLKFGFKNITRGDKIAFFVALAALIPWLITKDPTLSIVIAVGIDVVSFIPTLRKTFYNPETEQPLLFLMNVSRHILMLCALNAYNLATVLHSVVMILLNLTMLVLIYKDRVWVMNKKV